MSEFRKVIHPAGELIDFETVFEENPYLRTGVPSKKGTVERLDYTTAVYEDGKTYNKTAFVYLPYGYDKDDKSKRYNVLYFQHGNTCEPAMFAVGGNKPMFDMLFESGEIDPCIIVFVTYYFDPLGRENAEARVNDGFIPAGDGLWPNIPNVYYKEVVQDIVPAVELKYNTFLEENSDDAIKATRDHRGFCGYSRGCAMTWRMFHHTLEYFRWFAPMSGTPWGDIQYHDGHGIWDAGRMGAAMTEKEIADYVTAGVKAHPELPFFLFASNGGNEDVVPMTKDMAFITREDCFSYGLDPAKNNIYFSVSDFYHTDYLVPYYLWNSLKVLFKGV